MLIIFGKAEKPDSEIENVIVDLLCCNVCWKGGVFG